MPRNIKVEYEGRKIDIEFDAEEPIFNLKGKLQERTGLPVEQIKIYYSGPNREFDDDKTLRHYGLQFGAFFHMSDRRKDPTPAKPRRTSTPNLQHSDLAHQANQRQRIQQQRRNTTMMAPVAKESVDALLEEAEAEYKQMEDSSRQDATRARDMIAAKKAAKNKRRTSRRASSSLPVPEEAPIPEAPIPEENNNNNKPTSIVVKTPEGKSVQIQVEPTDTTESIQEKIAKETGIEVSNQILKDYTGKQVPKNKTAQELGLEEGSELMVDLAKVPVTVRMANGKETQIMVSPTQDSIADMKRQLEGETGIPAGNQKLSLQNDELSKDSQLAGDCGIKAGSVLDLEPKIAIAVKTPSGQTIHVQAKPSDTTEAIQEKIAKEAGIPVARQDLTFKGKTMAKGKKLQDMGVKHGSELKVDLLKMPVTVRTKDGKEIKLMVYPTAGTIQDLKAKLEKESGIPVDNQNLSMQGSELADGGKLATDCGISAGSVLDLEPKTITISVQTPSGKTIQIQAKPSYTTEAIQEQVSKEAGIPVAQQDLTFNGKPMETGKAMQDMGVRDGSELKVGVLKIPVTVRVKNGEEIKLMVDPTWDTIQDLKMQLDGESGIPMENQKLSLQGTELNDERKKATDCGITAGSVLDLEPKTITITVQTPNGKTIQVQVQPSDTADAIQENIAKEAGIPVAHQDLTFNGKPMAKGKALQDMGVQDGSELKVDVLKMPVSVRTKDGKEIKLMVDPTADTIQDMKKRLEIESGIPVGNQNLSIQGSQLEDGGKLATACGIKAGSVLDLEPKTITIAVQTPGGKTIQIEAKPSDTTESIQEKIAQEAGIPVSHQNLTFNGTPLANGNTLQDVGVKDGSELKVDVLKMPVTVRTKDGKEIKLMVDPTSDTIQNLKKQLEEESGIPADNQNLSIKGSGLEDGKKLASDCGISAGSVLDLEPKTITIAVQTPSGKTIQIQAKPSDSTEAIQERIAQEAGIPVAHMDLTFNGTPMAKGKTLQDTGVQDGSQLKVDVLKMPVTVRTKDGKEIQLMVDPTADTIQDMKKQLEGESGIPADNQSLSMSGTELLDGGKLASDCGITAGTVLDLEPQTMTVFVNTPSGTRVPVQVKASDKTDSIKQKIEQETGMSIPQQVLKDSNGSELEDGKTIEELELQDGSEISVCTAEVPVTVRTSDGKEIQLMVDPSSDSIGGIKEKLEGETGIASNNQRLSMDGKELDAAKNLAGNCGIQAGSVLDLEPKTMTVRVNTPDGKSISIQVEPSFTSRSIKEKVVREAGIPITQQVLEFNGKTFPNFKTVKDMGIKDGSELSVDVLKVPVTVRTHDGKEIQLMVNPTNDSIADLKQQLEGESGIPVARQKLSMLGNELNEPDKTAGDYGILSGSVLDLEPQTMTIGVKAPGGKVISVEVQPSDTVESVKEKIAKEAGVEASEHALKLNGKELPSSSTLEGCGIQSGCTLDLEPKALSITVNTPDGKSVSVQVKPSDTTEAIKERIAAEAGIEVPQQVLSLEGKELDNATTVEEMGAKDGAVLTLKSAKVPITINTPDGTQIHIDLDPRVTIGDIQEKLEGVTGIPTGEQKLMLEGNELSEPNKTVGEYKIKPGSFLSLERKKLEMTAESQKARLEEQKKLALAAERRRSSQKVVPEPKVELTEERKRKCYMWYARMAQPDRESMIRRVKKLDKSCDITVEEVEALPWMYGGSMLPVKEMNELFMNG